MKRSIAKKLNMPPAKPKPKPKPKTDAKGKEEEDQAEDEEEDEDHEDRDASIDKGTKAGLSSKEKSSALHVGPRALEHRSPQHLQNVRKSSSTR